MSALSDLIGRAITPERKGRNRPSTHLLDKPIQANTSKPHGQYEAAVFNFFLANKEQFGIKDVMKFTARLIDGVIELIDGRRLTLEIKFRMNWAKACQAEWQFRRFRERADIRPFPVDGGIVVFEEFSGDWTRQAASRLLENGWSHWYRGHAKVDGLRLDLFRLRDGKLEGYPIADVIVEKVKAMSEEDASKVLTALANQGRGK